MTARYLTLAQVAEATGVGTREVAKWVSRRNPNRFRRTKRQGRYWWRADALIEWLTGRGWQDKADAVAQWCVASAGTEVSRRRKPPARQSRRTAVAPPGGMDIFATRDVIAGMLVDTVAGYRGATALEIASSGKAVRDTADILRKIELDCLDVDQRLRRVIPLDYVERIVGRILAEARTNLQTLRYGMVEDLAAMTDTAAISAYLDDRFAASLRALEASYLAAQVDDYRPEAGA